VTTAHGNKQVKDTYFSSDGRFAVTLGDDNTIRVWDTADLVAEPPGFPLGSPEAVWRHMQLVLSLTLDEDDEVVPLWPEACASSLAGTRRSTSHLPAISQAKLQPGRLG